MPAQLLKCIDLESLPVGPLGPIPGVSFSVFDSSGGSMPTQISPLGAFVGLDAGYRLEIKLPKGVKAVCMRLVHLAQPPKVLFISPAGTTVGTVVLDPAQNVAQEVVGTSTAGIRRIIVIATSAETRLLSLCFG